MSNIIVNGYGPVPCDVMIVGEAPGSEESRQGRPFVGRSGVELRSYLNRGGLSLDDMYASNIVKRYVEGNPDPTLQDIAEWTPTLLREIREVQPKVVVAVGRFAAQWFLGEEASISVVHGMPHRAGAFDASRRERSCGACVIPTYHPAYGMRNNDGRALIGDDYMRVGEVVRKVLGGGEPEYRVDECDGEENYSDVSGDEFASHLSQFSHHISEHAIGIDTEGYPHSPWSIQVSCCMGDGVTLRYARPDFAVGIKALHNLVDNGILLVGHNFVMHDIAVCRAMGLDLSRARMWDNYYALYLLRLEPLGQKPAAYRWCGMQGQTYKELIAGAGESRQLDYLWAVMDREWAKPEPYLDWYNDGSVRMKQPNHVHRYVQGLLEAYYAKHIEEDKDDAKAEREGDEQAARTAPLTKKWRNIHTNVRGPVESVLGPFPTPTLDDVPLDVAVRYASRDPDQALRLYHKLLPELESKGVLDIMQRSVDTLPIFEEMQATGLPASRRKFVELRDKMQREMEELGLHISREYYGGKGFNPKAVDQVASLMRRHGLVGAKRTPKGKMSTGKPSIEHLRYEHPAIEAIMTWREKQHIKDMFCESTIQLMDEGRDVQDVHTRIKIANTTTRRLATADPNLLAFPKHEKPGGDYGKQVRRCFECPDGQVWLECDYSQIESRVLAHESGDPLLCELFHSGRDIHAETAARMFQVAPDQISGVQRFFAKKINFSIPYGTSEYGLATQLQMMGIKGWGVDECRKHIKSWKEDIYTTAAAYIEQGEQDVARTGLVRDCWGMMRYLPAVWSDEEKVAAEAKRQAVNHKIQGGAQGIIQNAMRGLRGPIREMQERGVGVWWTLQVHDALLFRVEECCVEEVKGVVLDGMVRYTGLEMRVPVLVDAKTAHTWGDL